MKQIIGLVLITGACLVGCNEQPKETEVTVEKNALEVVGHWLVDSAGEVMSDPQTSGLTHWQGQLISISDGSAVSEQQRRLHFIDPQNAQVTKSANTMSLSTSVRRSCFSDYLANEPDFEALVADPADAAVFYSVTEDATRTGALSVRCQQQFEASGSTAYPTLLVRLERSNAGDITITGVRPLQFPLEYKVGDFPNDGIEGMALTPERTLYLGLEKDTAGQPRIFTLNMNEDFFKSGDFAKVADPELLLPTFSGGNHPINGLEYYVNPTDGKGYLLAAARNDNELWVIDTAAETPTRRVLMDFTLATDSTDGSCPEMERMDNASIEGLAVIGETLWLINDPWKQNYLKNIQCHTHSAKYQAMAPLLFSTPIDQAWFTAP
ncbi:hypothetical protein CA267_012865 [Alteromonas pelagimontana]|uniref:Esterase-like activity of phytase family protein n=1 Tax=Alteromonas pelagimontana TaxID=1858656 RepID=A0A6M4MG57_9ALTE|nr:hypothetical protein [Alteromonas pelagimontana]QJR81595.1 hypothetical protein CA267_012865 [Alteromonas pelagimontana]